MATVTVAHQVCPSEADLFGFLVPVEVVEDKPVHKIKAYKKKAPFREKPAAEVNADMFISEILEPTLENILDLHEVLLPDSLQKLADSRSNRSTRVDIWDWVHQPLVGGRDSSKWVPFSLEACANVRGEDPEDLVKLFDYAVSKSVNVIHKRILARSSGEVIKGEIFTKTFQEAFEWFGKDVDKDDPFSFAVCCQSLNLDPDKYRQKVVVKAINTSLRNAKFYGPKFLSTYAFLESIKTEAASLTQFH